MKFTSDGLAKANLQMALLNNAVLNSILDILIKEHDLDYDKIILENFDSHLKNALEDIEEFSIKGNNEGGLEPTNEERNEP
ncbi:hypothetical protein [Lacihabitans soyangensis]|uniref:Uncharacterized protein n=1 Tax=Lacihabitans soyangensis TaxID=869394 RepID=A0AAE3H568_9BACT|nr:hypothetical protein [Lacihabitans soyangensis]MCP9765137.1 hypothetical protein [Lacihabitans soyangensis]